MPNACAGLSSDAATPLTRLAELPFTVSALHAPPSKERTLAFNTLHAVATAAGRKVLWCSPTREQARAAKDDQLADSAATISDAHTKLSSRHWKMPPGTLLIVDDAATAQPEVLADLAELVHQSHARLILINTTTQQWPPQPSRRLLRLLDTELPWSTTLGPAAIPQAANHRHSPDLDPIITQTRRLPTELLDDQLRQTLTRADQLRTTHLNTYQRHLKITWIRQRYQSNTLEHTQDRGIDLSDD